MTLLRWSAISAGVMSAVGALGLAFAAPYIGRSGLVLGALTVAVAVGAVGWYLAGMLDQEITRLLNRLDGFAKDGWKPTPVRSRFGLDAVDAQVERGGAALRGRVQDLITRRRELEIQARIADAETTHLQAILNSINDAVIVTDAFNEVALANGAAGRLLGFDASDASRQPLDRVLRDPVLLKLIKDTRESEASIRRSVEHSIPKGPGEQSVFNVNLSSIIHADRTSQHASGNAGVVTVLHDVTREREIAAAKSDFVANVSHELRTPLSSIKAYMEMLIDGEAETDEARAEFYNVIQGEANRLSRLIDNILNISRIESGVVKIQREELSLPRLAREAVDVLAPQATGKRIDLRLEECPAYFQVFADRDMILQVMLNLIGNAIKYTPEGGSVTARFDMHHQSREVVFAVSDTGLGIPAEDIPHLFDKFYRVADHKHAAKGTGLGLNLVKHVIETVHAGQVGIQSQVGIGSTFTFTLPIAENNGGDS